MRAFLRTIFLSDILLATISNAEFKMLASACPIRGSYVTPLRLVGGSTQGGVNDANVASQGKTYMHRIQREIETYKRTYEGNHTWGPTFQGGCGISWHRRVCKNCHQSQRYGHEFGSNKYAEYEPLSDQDRYCRNKKYAGLRLF